MSAAARSHGPGVELVQRGGRTSKQPFEIKLCYWPKASRWLFERVSVLGALPLGSGQSWNSLKQFDIKPEAAWPWQMH